MGPRSRTAPGVNRYPNRALRTAEFITDADKKGQIAQKKLDQRRGNLNSRPVMLMQRLGAAFAAAAIALGAFGAHALESRLEQEGSTGTWETAVLYHLIHALALFALAGNRRRASSAAIKASSSLWVAGILLFSGSLYGLALVDWPFLGPITPIGGLCLIAGWVVLLFPRSDASA